MKVLWSDRKVDVRPPPLRTLLFRTMLRALWGQVEGRASTYEGQCKATKRRELKLPWREASPPDYHDDNVDSNK